MKEPKRTLLFDSIVKDEDKISAFQIGGVLCFYYNDELIYKIPLPALFTKKGRRRIEDNITSQLLDRAVDTSVIEKLFKGVVSNDA